MTDQAPVRQHCFYLVHRVLDWLWRRRWLHWSLWGLNLLAVSTASICSLFLTAHGHFKGTVRTDPGRQSDFGSHFDAAMAWAAEFTELHYATIGVVLVICIPVFRVLRWILWKTVPTSIPMRGPITGVLGKCRELLLQDEDINAEYRLTLFQERSIFGWCRWLGIFSRTTDSYRRWNTVFAISTEGKERCTGVAGYAWWQAIQGRRQVIFAGLASEGLPKSKDTGVSLADTDALLAPCERARISVNAVSFATVPVVVRGKVWGLLVFDTNDPKWAKKSTQQRNQFVTHLEFAATAVLKMLE